MSVLASKAADATRRMTGAPLDADERRIMKQLREVEVERKAKEAQERQDTVERSHVHRSDAA